ncbi:hypothetical protein ACWEKM_31370 [Streptomyces sp. NPDC004752]
MTLNHEQLIPTSTAPMLCRTQVGDPHMPTVVFLPGGGHTARMGHGHTGTEPEHFLAHWLSRRGLSYIGASYPSDRPEFPDSCPNLLISAWGQAAAEVCRQAVDEFGVSDSIILCVWSMAGRAVHAFSTAARRLGLNVICAVSLAASPPLPGVVPLPEGGEPLNDQGLWDLDHRLGGSMFDRWFKDLPRTTAGHPVISEEQYLTHYVCRHSVALRGEPQRLAADDGTDLTKASQADAGFGQWSSFPICCAITPTSPADLRHALTDHLTWPMFTGQLLYSKLAGAPDENTVRAWPRIRELSRQLSDRLCREVDGNHFFFLGREGAEATAAMIIELWRAADSLEDEVLRLTGVSLTHHEPPPPAP